MAAVPSDPGAMPGEDTGPDQSAVDQVNAAISQGYNYADVVAYHSDNNLPAPPQPSLDAIMAGNTSDASQWSAPPTPGGDNDPTKLDTPAAAQASINQLAEAGAGIGMVEEVGAALGSTVRSMVQTTTEELQGAMTPLDLAVERGAATVQRVAGSKTARAIAGGAAFEGTMNADMRGKKKASE